MTILQGINLVHFQNILTRSLLSSWMTMSPKDKRKFKKLKKSTKPKKLMKPKCSGWRKKTMTSSVKSIKPTLSMVIKILTLHWLLTNSKNHQALIFWWGEFYLSTRNSNSQTLFFPTNQANPNTLMLLMISGTSKIPLIWMMEWSLNLLPSLIKSEHLSFSANSPTLVPLQQSQT